MKDGNGCVLSRFDDDYAAAPMLLGEVRVLLTL